MGLQNTFLESISWFNRVKLEDTEYFMVQNNDPLVPNRTIEHLKYSCKGFASVGVLIVSILIV